MSKSLSKLYRLFSSFGLACVVLIFLLILVLLGTLEQTRIGLYLAQKKYFESLVAFYPLPGKLALPLPGGYLLMTVLGINLLIGGIIRLKRRRVLIGMYIVHGGILFMLLGAFITHQFALEGNMALNPGQTSS